MSAARGESPRPSDTGILTPRKPLLEPLYRVREDPPKAARLYAPALELALLKISDHSVSADAEDFCRPLRANRPMPDQHQKCPQTMGRSPLSPRSRLIRTITSSAICFAFLFAPWMTIAPGAIAPGAMCTVVEELVIEEP